MESDYLVVNELVLQLNKTAEYVPYYALVGPITAGLVGFFSYRLYKYIVIKQTIGRQVQIIKSSKEASVTKIRRELENAGQNEKVSTLSWNDLIQGLRSGEVLAVQALQSYQSRAIELDAKINCITGWLDDAIQQARYLDTLSPSERGPLHGVPFSIKECYNIAGLDSTAGMIKFAGNPASKDCPVVTLLKQLGGVPFCKTNVPQTMYSLQCSNILFGTTENPHKPGQEVGGSNGGEGAIFSLKPTHGRHLTQLGVVSPSGTEPVGIPVWSSAEALCYCWKLTWDLKESPNQVDCNLVPLSWNENLFIVRTKIGYFSMFDLLEPKPGAQRAVLEAVQFLRKLGYEGKSEVNQPNKHDIELGHYNVKLIGKPGSWTAISNCDGIHEVIYDGEEPHHIQKMHPLDLFPNRHVVYRHQHFHSELSESEPKESFFFDEKYNRILEYKRDISVSKSEPVQNSKISISSLLCNIVVGYIHRKFQETKSQAKKFNKTIYFLSSLFIPKCRSALKAGPDNSKYEVNIEPMQQDGSSLIGTGTGSNASTPMNISPATKKELLSPLIDLNSQPKVNLEIEFDQSSSAAKRAVPKLSIKPREKNSSTYVQSCDHFQIWPYLLLLLLPLAAAGDYGPDSSADGLSLEFGKRSCLDMEFPKNDRNKLSCDFFLRNLDPSMEKINGQCSCSLVHPALEENPNLFTIKAPEGEVNANKYFDLVSYPNAVKENLRLCCNSDMYEPKDLQVICIAVGVGTDLDEGPQLEQSQQHVDAVKVVGWVMFAIVFFILLVVCRKKIGQWMCSVKNSFQRLCVTVNPEVRNQDVPELGNQKILEANVAGETVKDVAIESIECEPQKMETKALTPSVTPDSTPELEGQLQTEMKPPVTPSSPQTPVSETPMKAISWEEQPPAEETISQEIPHLQHGGPEEDLQGQRINPGREQRHTGGEDREVEQGEDDPLLQTSLQEVQGSRK